MSDSRRVALLSVAEIEGLRALSTEPDVAAVMGVNVALTPEQAAEYIATVTSAQEHGRSYVFVLTDATNVLGICRLIGILGVPRLIVAVGHAWRGQGNGRFLVEHVLEFAFNTLGLELVTATGPCLSIVSQFGHLSGNGLSRQDWLAARRRG